MELWVEQFTVAEREPRIDHVYWLRNQVEVGGANYLALCGSHLDLLQSFRVTLKELKSGREEVLTLPIVAVRGSGGRPIRMPQQFGGLDRRRPVRGGGGERR